MQAVDRCDYVFAIIVTKMVCIKICLGFYLIDMSEQAIEKCPSKGSLHHLLAELLLLTGDTAGCIKAAERAFQINVSLLAD